MIYNEQIRIAPYNGERILDGNALSWVDITEQFIVGLTVPIPAAKQYEIDVPGRHGKLDLTDALGGVKYNNRLCKLKLVAKSSTTEANIDVFIQTYNGKRCVIDVQAEGYKLIGRLSVLDKKEQKAERILMCEFDAEPLKISRAVYERIWGTEPKTNVAHPVIVSHDGAYEVQYGSSLEHSGPRITYKQASETEQGSSGSARIICTINLNGDGVIPSMYNHWIAVVDPKFRVLKNGEDITNILTTPPSWKIIQFNSVVLDMSSNERRFLVKDCTEPLSLILESCSDGYYGSLSDLTFDFEFLMVSMATEEFTNNGTETILYYDSSDQSGTIRICLNDRSVLNRNIGGYLPDPRLTVKKGGNVVCVFRNFNTFEELVNVTDNHDSFAADIYYKEGDFT